MVGGLLGNSLKNVLVKQFRFSTAFWRGITRRLHEQSVFDKSRIHHHVYVILYFRKAFSGPFSLLGYVGWTFIVVGLTIMCAICELHSICLKWVKHNRVIFFVEFSPGFCAFLFQDGENHMLNAHHASLLYFHKLSISCMSWSAKGRSGLFIVE